MRSDQAANGGGATAGQGTTRAALPLRNTEWVAFRDGRIAPLCASMNSHGFRSAEMQFAEIVAYADRNLATGRGRGRRKKEVE